MNYTTTTKLARKGRKEFDDSCKIVMHNNEDIGLIAGGAFYRALIENGVLDQVREELRESKDDTTVKLIQEHKALETSATISFDDFKKKYDL